MPRTPVKYVDGTHSTAEAFYDFNWDGPNFPYYNIQNSTPLVRQGEVHTPPPSPTSSISSNSFANIDDEELYSWSSSEPFAEPLPEMSPPNTLPPSAFVGHSNEHQQGPKPQRKRDEETRIFSVKRRRRRDCTLSHICSSGEDPDAVYLTPFLDLPQSEAASLLGINQSVLSAKWKEFSHGSAWPRRELKKIDRALEQQQKKLRDGGALERGHSRHQALELMEQLKRKRVTLAVDCYASFVK